MRKIDSKKIERKRKSNLLPLKISQKEKRHIIKEILEEMDDIYPTDSLFWSEFFKKTNLDAFDE